VGGGGGGFRIREGDGLAQNMGPMQVEKKYFGKKVDSRNRAGDKDV